MSSSTWTPAALSSDARALAGTCWRLVEAQHHVSTLKLLDSVDEQKLLEELIEATKPPLPPECRDLHYLLSTPFRYGAVYPIGSRFRRAGMTEGVFYASETPQTAVAEMAFHRLLFFAESPNTLSLSQLPFQFRLPLTRQLLRFRDLCGGHKLHDAVSSFCRITVALRG